MPQKRMTMSTPNFRRIAEEHQEEISALARDLVRIDTTNTGVMPTGNETEAARYLARPDSTVVTICGCGNQGRVQLEALVRVCPIRRVHALVSSPSTHAA